MGSGISGRSGVSVDGGAALTTANQLSSYGTGSAYTVTNAAAAIVMGTTSPTITVNQPGTYLIIARARYELVGATFAASRLVTLKLNRTNNSAADLTGGTSLYNTPIVTTLTNTMTELTVNAIYTTTNTDDVIVLSTLVGTVPSAGSLTVNEASIIAIRLQQ